MRSQVTVAALIGAVVLLALGGAAQAAMLVPVGATGTSPSYGSPTNLINSSGLLGTGPTLTRAHQTTHTQGWLINNTDPANELVFQMPGPADLTGLHAWQYEQAGCCQGRGVNTFDVSFSTDNGGTYGAPISLSLNPSTVIPGNETAQTRAFPLQTGVTHVKFTNMTDFPTLHNPGWQGLNEVRFEAVPKPVRPGFFMDEDVQGNLNGWSGWGGTLTAPYLNLLPAAGDIDAPALTNATSVPDALNVLNNAVPYINNTAVAMKETTISIQPGTYEFHVQMGNWNNGAFPNPQLNFNGLTPDVAATPAPASGHDEIWRYRYTVAPGDPAVGQLANLSFQGTGTGNYAVDHVLGTFTAPPLPTTDLTIGQELTNRGSRDGGAGHMFAAESFGFDAGTVTEWSIRGHTSAFGGTRNITPVILEQTGATGLGAFTVRGIGTAQTLSHTADVQTFSFGLTRGSAQMGPRHYLGWIDSDGGAGTNAGTVSYSGGDHFTLWVNAPGTIGVGDTYSVSNLNRRYSLQATIEVAGGEAVGNGAGQRAHEDTANGAVFMVVEAFTQAGTLDEWAFWSWTGRNVTPLIFEDVGGNFVLRGVGTSRQVPNNQGTITYPFGLQSGSDFVDADYYFGWVGASVDAVGTPTNNPGVIRYADDETFSATIRYFGGNHGFGAFAPGADFGAGTPLDRAYSVQAFAVADLPGDIPEPVTMLAVFAGLAGLGGYARKRRRATA